MKLAAASWCLVMKRAGPSRAGCWPLMPSCAFGVGSGLTELAWPAFSFAERGPGPFGVLPAGWVAVCACLLSLFELVLMGFSRVHESGAL